MKRHKTIRKLPVIASRWSMWATQLTARLARWTDFSGLDLILPLRGLARTLLLVQQRWLSSYLQVQPRLNLSISRSNQQNFGSNNVYASQLTLLKLLSPELQRSGRGRPLLVDRRGFTTSLAPQRGSQPAMTLALERTTSEHLSATLNRYLSLRRRDDVTEFSRLITQHTQRQVDVFMNRPPLALPVTAANRIASRQIAWEAMPETASFKRQSSFNAAPEMVPPSLDVELLADQVLKQIDRRVIARRERMGQI